VNSGSPSVMSVRGHPCLLDDFFQEKLCYLTGVIIFPGGCENDHLGQSVHYHCDRIMTSRCGWGKSVTEVRTNRFPRCA
jgi:hypothetical protein